MVSLGFLDENNLYRPEHERFYEMMYREKQDIEYIKMFVPGVQAQILELGCGTGRVILDLAATFRDKAFAGLDHLGHYVEVCLRKARSIAELTEALQSRRLRFIEGDMCAFGRYFDPSDRFGFIILCNSTLLHCKAREEMESLFKCAAERLSPDGIFFVEYALTFSETWDWEEKEIDDPDYKLFRKNVFNRQTNTARRFFRFQKKQDPEEVKELHVTANPVDYEELKEIIQSNGLVVIREEQGFSGESEGRRKILFMGKKDRSYDLPGAH